MSRGAMLAQVAIEAQYSVLGAMLIDPDCVGEVLLRVKDQEFIEPSYRLVYQAIRKLYNAGRPTDPLSVNDALGGDSRQLLADCITLTPTAANVMEWVEILKRRALQYRLAELGDKLAEAEDLDAALGFVDEINAASCQKEGVKITSLSKAYAEFLDRHGEEQQPPYLTWGISALDERVHIERGDMVVLGGYPSAGKTALALQFCRHMGKDKRVGYFYLENNDKKLFDRLVASTAMVSFGRIKKHELGEDDFHAILSMREQLTAPQIEFVGASGMTVADIRSVALSRHYDVVAVDYLQKIRGDRARRGLSDFEKVSQVSSDLQEMGQQTGITILALSQLSRPEKKTGEAQAPTMASLRQSGQIEQDADVVFLVYRTEESNNKMRSLKIAKNKEGESNLVMEMVFDGDTQTFARIAPSYARESRQKQPPRQQSFWGDGSGWKQVPDSADNPFREEQEA